MSKDWVPQLDASLPVYRAIVNALASDIGSAQLRAGTRLPTHRELAHQLDVNVGTVTRAYAEAKELGLISGEIGRGTFVTASPAASGDRSASDVIDLMLNKPATVDGGNYLKTALRRLSENQAMERFLEYPRSIGSDAHRLAGANLARLAGVAAGPDSVVITNGAQQALFAALSAQLRPGDLVATERLNYAGIRYLADFLHVRVAPLAIDRDGLDPDALEALCRRERVSALVVTPNVHNPTTATLPLDRRRAIAAISARYELPVVENDVYGALVENPLPSLRELGAFSCCYVFGTSKSIAPGLRVGYLIAPPPLVGRLIGVVHATTWAVAPLLAEMVHLWTLNGTVERLVAAHRAEIRARQALAREVLAGLDFAAHPQSYHLWLSLPFGWRPQDFVEACAAARVSVTPSSAFSIDPTYYPANVRISLGAEDDGDRLREGLERIAAILAQRPSAMAITV